MILLNGEVVEIGKFPNGEQYVPLKSLILRAYNKVEWMYEGDHEFVSLSILRWHIQAVGKKAWLKLNYMPHSRMDRANEDYAFSLKYVSKLVNDMMWDSVQVTEPHSDVTPALLEDCVVTEWCQGHLLSVAMHHNSIFFPDAGAQKRYNTNLRSAVGIKQRDFKTGDITSFDLHGDVGSSVLIVDDLCSRGGTFVHSAKLLKEHGARNVSLLVAHCEQTVFTGSLFEHIGTLYTSAHNNLPEHKQITILKD